jgi:hypothetical protein
MIPFLAQADVNNIPASLLKSLIMLAIVLIVVASFAAAGLFAGLQYFLDKRKESKAGSETQPRSIGPIPLPVNLVEKFVEHKTFDAHVAETRKNFADRDRHRETDQKDAKDGRKLIYDKIESSRKENATLTENVRRDLSEEIRSIPGEVITTLKNTGAI